LVAKLRDTQKDILSLKYNYLTIFVADRTKIVKFKIGLTLLFSAQHLEIK